MAAQLSSTQICCRVLTRRRRKNTRSATCEPYIQCFAAEPATESHVCMWNDCIVFGSHIWNTKSKFKNKNSDICSGYVRTVTIFAPMMSEVNSRSQTNMHWLLRCAVMKLQLLALFFLWISTVTSQGLTWSVDLLIVLLQLYSFLIWMYTLAS